MSDHDIYYWAARAAEERQIAAALPEGPPASVHRKLADLYEQILRRCTYGYEARNVADADDQPGICEFDKIGDDQPIN